jgi:hypothetical protein
MDPIRAKLGELFAHIALIPRGAPYQAARDEHMYLGIRCSELAEREPRTEAQRATTERQRAALIADIERIDAAVLAVAVRLRNGGQSVAS